MWKSISRLTLVRQWLEVSPDLTPESFSFTNNFEGGQDVLINDGNKWLVFEQVTSDIIIEAPVGSGQLVSDGPFVAPYLSLW